MRRDGVMEAAYRICKRAFDIAFSACSTPASVACGRAGAMIIAQVVGGVLTAQGS